MALPRTRAGRRSRRRLFDRACSRVEYYFKRITRTIDAATGPVDAVGRLRTSLNAVPEKRQRSRGPALAAATSTSWIVWALMQPGADFWPNPLQPLIDAPGGRFIAVLYVAVIVFRILNRPRGSGSR